MHTTLKNPSLIMYLLILFTDIGYECERRNPSVDGPPPCWTDGSVCYNGGTRAYESDKCWCICPESWQGHHDCSLPTRNVADFPVGSSICK